MQATLNTSHLRAAACCSCDRDVRYYLNGVLVEVRATETRCVATNGECAAVLRDLVVSGVQEELPDVIIPSEAIKLVLSRPGNTAVLEFDNGKWSLAGISFAPVDGTFPPYRRIIPSQHSGEAAQFSLNLLARFGKIAKALGVRSNPVIRHNGEGAAQVQIIGREGEFVGVIMPLRAFDYKHPDPGLVRWGAESPAPVDDLADLV